MTGRERRADLLVIMGRLIILAVVAGIIGAITGCGGNIPPTPSPTPPPSLPPMPLLTINGSQFIPPIVGAAPGSGSVPFGWPDASGAFLDLLHERGLNYAHTRSGPFIRDGEPDVFEGYVWTGAGYDLSHFNEAYDKKERDFLGAAQQRGIYVERVVLDDWPPKYNLWPYAAGKNINGVAFGPEVFQRENPPLEIQKWVRHRIANTCQFPNVLYQLDNEPRPVRTSAEWTRQLYSIARDEMHLQNCPLHPVGSANSDAWDTVDYQVLHTFRVPSPSLKPILVNETDNRDTNAIQYVLRAYASQGKGIYFQFWPGPLEESLIRVTEVLDLYGKMNKGLPPPEGYEGPSFGCPEFKGIKIEILRHDADKYVLNASPKPISEGQDPNSSLGSTLCEDLWINSEVPMRYQDGWGPKWRIVEGAGTIEPNWANTYLAFVRNPEPGTVIEACSQRDSNCGRFTF